MYVERCLQRIHQVIWVGFYRFVKAGIELFSETPPPVLPWSRLV